MKTFAPEEISAMVLTKMKETAEAYLGRKVRRSSLNPQALFLGEKGSPHITSSFLLSSIYLLRSPTLLSLCLRTSTMLSVRPQRTLAPSPD